MGKTYHKNSKKFDEESSGRSGKPARHASGKKTGGMRTLNSYVDEEYDLNDDSFNVSNNKNSWYLKDSNESFISYLIRLNSRIASL